MAENVITFGADMNSSAHLDNKGKDILIFGEGPTKGLDDTTLIAEAKYRISFTQSNRKFVLVLHYNESNSFLFANATKICQFKANDSETKNIYCVQKLFQRIPHLLTGKRTEFNGCTYKFYVYIDISNIIDIYKFLMKIHDMK